MSVTTETVKSKARIYRTGFEVLDSNYPKLKENDWCRLERNAIEDIVRKIQCAADTNRLVPVDIPAGKTPDRGVSSENFVFLGVTILKIMSYESASRENREEGALVVEYIAKEDVS